MTRVFNDLGSNLRNVSTTFAVGLRIVNWVECYETRQTPLLYVFVDLKVHNVQKNSYHFDCIDQ